MTGDKVIQISFWVMLAFLYFVIVSLAIEQSSSLVDILSGHCKLKIVTSSPYLNIVFYSVPILVSSIPFLYALAVMYIRMEPITTNIVPILRNWTIFNYSLRILMYTFEIWNFSTFSIIGGMFVCEGMLCSYIALYEVAKDLHKQALKTLLKTRFNYAKLKSLISSYDEVRLYISQVNDCYQETFTVRYNPIIISVSVILATILINRNLRPTTSSVGLYLCGYTVVNCYMLIAIGYYFPGKVNEFSRKTLPSFTRFIACDQINSKNRKCIKEFKKNNQSM